MNLLRKELLSWLRVKPLNTCLNYSQHSIISKEYKPKSRKKQTQYLELVLKFDSLDINEWKDLKKKILTECIDINEINIDSFIMKTAVHTKNYNAVNSFINYLRKEGDLSLGVMNTLLRFYNQYAKENTLSSEQKQHILNIHKILYEKYKTVDNITGQNLLQALCSLDEWEKGVKVFNDILANNSLTPLTFNTLIATLFRNNEKVKALKYIKFSLNSGIKLLYCAYDEWIKYIFRNYSDSSSIIQFLNEICLFISTNQIIVHKKICELLMNSYVSLGWKAEFTSILKQSGQCKSCKRKLDCLKLTEDEFSMLQKHVKKTLLVGKDAFMNSSPEELRRFSKFIRKTTPYDVVLDGLNIAYSANGPPDIERLFKIIYYFAKKKKIILLFGRKHMLQWNNGQLTRLFKYSHSKVHTFFIENISQDDPFFITATLLSGSHTDFVTRDLLRDRFFDFDHNLKGLFKRWQWQHQIMFNEQQIQEPLCFTPWPQQNNGGWHLPYENTMTESMESKNIIPNCSCWLCLMPRNTL